MARIHTLSIVTLMTNIKSIRDFTVVNLPTDPTSPSMLLQCVAVLFKATIRIGYTPLSITHLIELPRPLPASVFSILIDFIPKSIYSHIDTVSEMAA